MTDRYTHVTDGRMLRRATSARREWDRVICAAKLGLDAMNGLLARY